MPDLPPRPVLDGTAEIDAALWSQYQNAKTELALIEDTVRVREKMIREEAGNARYLIVDGQRVAVRVIQDVAGVSFRKDFYRKIGKTDD